MDNQHNVIKGYRDLSPDEIATMNRIKSMAQECEKLVESLSLAPGVDYRWVFIGKTDLQTGFMALVRSVARPTSF